MLYEAIGKAAMLEQTAEEAAELPQPASTAAEIAAVRARAVIFLRFIR